MPKLSELIYALLVSKYADLSKATEGDLQELAEHSIRAAEVFNEVYLIPK